MLGHMTAFRPNRVKPMLAVIAIGGPAIGVIQGEPVGALPSTIGPKFSTCSGQPVIERADFCLACGRPLNLREMHGIFVAIGLDGLGRWVDFGKEEFVGRNSLQAELQTGPRRDFVTLTIDDPDDGAPFGEAVYLSTVLIDGAAAGLVVSAGYGHRVGKSIVMAVLDKAALAKGGDIYVDVLGRERAAHIVEGGVLYDPDNRKMKV